MSSNATLTQDQRTAVLDKVRYHHAEISRLYQFLNAHEPIMHLPEEVLIHIFLFVKQSQGRYCWLHITHVCHYWRQIALEAPRLWTDILVDKNLRYINAFVSRSGQAELSVKNQPAYIFSDDWALPAWEHVLENSWRIGSLKYTVLNVHVKSHLAPQWYTRPREFASLRSLELSIVAYTPTWGTPPLKEIYHFLPRSGPFPLLQQFSAWHLPFHTIKHFIVPSLQSLSLHFPLTSSLTWREVLDSFRELSKLEVLQLEDTNFHLLPGLYAESSSCSNPVALPRLKYLGLKCGRVASATAVVLDNLRFPGTTRMHLYYGNLLPVQADDSDSDSDTEGAGAVDDMSCVARAISSRLPEGTVEPILSLQIQQRHPGWLHETRVECWQTVLPIEQIRRSAFAPDDEVSDTTSSLVVHLQLPFKATALPHLCQIPILWNARTLVIDGSIGGEGARRDLSTWLSHMDQLTSISTQDYMLLDKICSALLPSRSGESVIPCPSLSLLDLGSVGAAFRAQDLPIWEESSAVLKAVRERKELGSQLERIIVPRSTHEDIVKCLSKYVKEVQAIGMDGRLLESSSSSDTDSSSESSQE